jgi:TRAP-type uncharacterized transport system substrate-binding protein
MKHCLASLAVIAALLAAQPARALDGAAIEILTLPFGTSSYSTDMGMESFFKEINGPLRFLLKQTPGAMYITRYNHENREKMVAGKIPFTITLSTAAITPYVAKGLPPYQDFPLPSRVLCAIDGLAIVWVTFDPAIQSPADFAGQKVGVAERSRPNQSELPNRPVFDHAYGGYDKVDWQYLGFGNSKDALLNGSIAVHAGNLSGEIKTAPDGTLYMDSCTPDPALMEIISAGRPFHFVSEDPAVLRAAYDPEKHLVHFPVLIKAGAVPNLTEDAWAKGGFIVYSGDMDMPAEAVEEMVYQMWSKRDRLADFYEGFRTMGASPYPAGCDPQYIHPGLFRALNRLGIALPEGVSAPE